MAMYSYGKLFSRRCFTILPVNMVFSPQFQSRARRAVTVSLAIPSLLLAHSHSRRGRQKHSYCDQICSLVDAKPFSAPPLEKSIRKESRVSFSSIFHLQSILHSFELLFRSLYLYICISPALFTFPLFLLGYAEDWAILLRSCITSCGPCSIKLAQWIATRPDLFPLTVCNALEGLQAKARGLTSSEIKTSLCTAFGDNWTNIISLDPNHLLVLGSGCVAQVVLGEYKGRKVAVKILHPRIRQDILIDLEILHLLTSLIELIPGLPNISMAEIGDEFSSLMLSQLDMNVEAHAIDRFRRNFAPTSSFSSSFDPWSRLSFPKIYISTVNVLVESFEEGMLMSELLKTPLTALQRKEMAKTGLNAFLKMVFDDNFIHGDLHPGNIIVKTTPNSTGFQMVFIDCGITVALGEQDRKNFIDLFAAIVRNEGIRVGRLMVERSRGKQCINQFGFETRVADIVSSVHARGLNLQNISVGALLQQILLLCYTHEVKLESRYANLLLAIAVVEGLGRKLDPDIDLIRSAAPYVFKSAARQVFQDATQGWS